MLALLLLAGFTLPLIRSLRRLLSEMRAAGAVRPGNDSYVFLRRLERLLRSRGLTRLPPETPLEFARRAGGKLHSPVPIEITGLYYQARFGGYPLTPSDLRKIEDGLARLR